MSLSLLKIPHFPSLWNLSPASSSPSPPSESSVERRGHTSALAQLATSAGTRHLCREGPGPQRGCPHTHPKRNTKTYTHRPVQTHKETPHRSKYIESNKHTRPQKRPNPKHRNKPTHITCIDPKHTQEHKDTQTHGRLRLHTKSNDTPHAQTPNTQLRDPLGLGCQRDARGRNQEGFDRMGAVSCCGHPGAPRQGPRGAQARPRRLLQNSLVASCLGPKARPAPSPGHFRDPERTLPIQTRGQGVVRWGGGPPGSPAVFLPEGGGFPAT